MLTFLPAAARPLSTRPSVTGDDSYNKSVNSNLTILIITIVIAFVLLAIYIYICRCTGDNSAVAPAMIAGIGGGQSRREVQKGLDSYLLEKFPTMVYSSVKAQKLGKESLECAVCLCEFEDDDVLRLLPRCSHVYHRDCIDVWFATHFTCPVCRTNLAAENQDQQPEMVDVVSISVEEVADGEDRHPDLENLVRIESLRREARSGSVKRVPMISRSATYWESGERFRLRLPEDIRREIMAAGELRRSASYAVSRGEERGAGEGGTGKGSGVDGEA
ncbi:E3 ubiquitin-protein ligase ATL31-like [Phalaenopsis equestris]|uniref:E3 ubiquitin-protein ligase ATL31-like n=1 Tax=Phalaenopsis equestris TaxID=78828 RepID=UPI0009E365DA|nr:E3 ubiquitin-protein ligase ATL31-like [Phalaenopsis equestris]